MGPIGIRFKSIAVVAASVIALAACGGGGGSSSSSASGITYTGQTGPATITGTDATKISGAVMSTSGSYSAASTLLNGATISATRNPALAKVVKQVADTVRAMANNSDNLSSAAGASTTSTVYGCTGQAAVTVTSNSSTSVTLSISFSNFEANDLNTGSCPSPALPTFNGSATLSYTLISYNSTRYPTNESVTFTNLTVAYPSASIALNGTFGLGIQWDTSYTTMTGLTFSMDAVYSDSATGAIYKASGYQATMDGNFNLLTVKGTVYEPSSGYVTISTTNQLSYGNSSCPSIPQGGDIHLIGANNTWADIIPGPGSSITDACTQYTLNYGDATNTVSTFGTY